MINTAKRCIVVTIVILTLAMLASCGSKAGDDRLSVTFIDVGKGDCILIENDGSYAMIDTGYEETVSAVMKVLDEKGINTIDHLIITHYDKDHVGGAAALLGKYDIKKIYLPAYEGSSKYYSAIVSAIEAGTAEKAAISQDTDFALSDKKICFLVPQIGLGQRNLLGRGDFRFLFR